MGSVSCGGIASTRSGVVRAEESESGQGYTPFEGQELRGKVKQTYLRGTLIYDRGNIVGQPTGRYLNRSIRERVQA